MKNRSFALPLLTAGIVLILILSWWAVTRLMPDPHGRPLPTTTGPIEPEPDRQARQDTSRPPSAILPTAELAPDARVLPLAPAERCRAWLSGRMRSASGTPLSGRVMIRSLNQEGGVEETAFPVSATEPFGPLPVRALEPLLVTATSPGSGRVAIGPLLALPGEVLELGDVRLAPACSLSGTLSMRDGRPAAAAELTIRRSRDRMSDTGLGRPIVARTTTNTTGLFTIHDLAPEAYDVTIDHPEAAATEILGLRAAPDPAVSPMHLSLAPSTEIAGAVLDSRGAPLEGALVAARSLSNDSLCARETRTAQDGSFRLDRLREGYYTLTADADGHLAATKRQIVTGVRTLRFRLLRAGRLEGTVVDAGAGRPADRFTLTLLAAAHGTDPPEVATRGRRFLFAGASGGFILPGLAPAPYWLLARTADGASRLAGPFMVSPGSGTPSGPIGIGPGTRLHGRVVGADGRGLTAWVTSVDPRQKRIDRLVRPPQNAPGIDAVTSPEGLIDVTGALPGRFCLLIRARDHAPFLSGPIENDPARPSIDVGPFRLVRAAEIHGVLRLDRTSEPVEHLVELVARDASHSWATIADSAGHWRFTDLPPGDYELRVHTESPAGDDPLAPPLQLDLSPTIQRRVGLGAGESRELEIDLRGR